MTKTLKVGGIAVQEQHFGMLLKLCCYQFKLDCDKFKTLISISMVTYAHTRTS